MKQIFSVIFFLYCMCACKQESLPSAVKFDAPRESFCLADSLNRYHFIKPEKSSKALPLLIILDSGGDGLFALHKVAPALGYIPCVAIASDRVKNNFREFDAAIDMLIDDASRQFEINMEQVYILGFSGGARMAYSYSVTHRVTGIIMCSAAPPANAPISCPVYVISGTADFNFAETYKNPLNPGLSSPYKTDYFEGTHAWPPSRHLEDALLYMMRSSVPDYENIAHQKARVLKQQSDSLVSEGGYLLAWKALEKAKVFDSGNKKIRKSFLNLKKDKECRLAISGIESDLMAENSIFQSYGQAMLKNDSVWWKNTIAELKTKINAARGSEKDHLMRIKGFLGIAFYSQLNFMLSSESYPSQVQNILAAYRIAEPDNPDVYYAYARFAQKQHQPEKAQAFLSKALSLGFTDHERMKTDFPGILPIDRNRPSKE